MTLKQWSDNGWLRPHKATTEEIENLFQIVNRDLKDARSGVSPDWRFGIAYNAALKLCTQKVIKQKEIYSIIEQFRLSQKYWGQKKVMMQIISTLVEQSESGGIRLSGCRHGTRFR